MSDPLGGLPRAELHVHLEGAISPETLLALAELRGVDLPASDLEGLRSWFRFRDFEHFVEIYLTCSRCLRDPEDFLRIACDFIAEQRRQHVVYTEAHFTIGTHILNRGEPSEILDALERSVVWGRERGIELRFIFDIVRNVPEMADATLEWALRGHELGIVVGLGLSGFEDHPSDVFADHFREAERKGLHRTAHAGEHAGPESIWSALEYARAERIGHGIRSIEDPELLKHLTREEVVLEVCPTSNVQLHAVHDYETHPFAQLDRVGVPVTVNSDDPWLFDSSLTNEYRVLAERFDYDSDGLERIARVAFSASFAEASLRDALVADFDSAVRGRDRPPAAESRPS